MRKSELLVRCLVSNCNSTNCSENTMERESGRAHSKTAQHVPLLAELASVQVPV